MSGPDWVWLKAQYYQESKLNPKAVSPVGARGICQAMPGTWADIQRALGWENVSPHSAPHCILGGAFYQQQMNKLWKSPRPGLDRHFLALSSYNAGAGNIIKAQKLCGGVASYDKIIACLYRVTGITFASETLGYVTNIRKWRLRMANRFAVREWHH